MAAPVGVANSLLNVRRVRGNAAQEVGCGGGGDGEGAVGAFDGATSHIDRRAVPGADVQMDDTGGGADDIDDGVYGSDLVEVNLVNRHVVDLGL